MEVTELNRTIEGLRAQNKTYAKQLEELENRLFILSDQLESRTVNENRQAAPALPTVTLHPEVAAEEKSTDHPADLALDEPEVEYAGEAARSTTQRPVLRLHGDTAQVTIRREPSRAEPRSITMAKEGTMPKASGGGEAVSAYRRSYQQLVERKHAEAAQGFRTFLRQYPNHDLADNAQYWLGECFYDRKEFAAAVREFRRVIERHPQGNKVPDALLKVGFSYLALGSEEAGRQTLEQLQRSYPRHEAAALAAARLAEGKGSSHSDTGSSAPLGASHGPKEVP